MTEAEWLACDDVDPMLKFLGALASKRKLRLLAVACCRRQPVPRRTGAWGEKAEHLAELFSDGLASVEQLSHAQQEVKVRLYLEAGEPVYEAGYWACSSDVVRDVRRAASYSANSVAAVVLEEPEGNHQDRYFAARDSERQWQCQLLRDIFGNPFRPVAFDPAWRTDTAVAVARTMYDSREFSAMPILADALQDAGCEDEQVLNHCRDANQAYVRGCWVCDLVLGNN